MVYQQLGTDFHNSEIACSPQWGLEGLGCPVSKCCMVICILRPECKHGVLSWPEFIQM